MTRLQAGQACDVWPWVPTWCGGPLPWASRRVLPIPGGRLNRYPHPAAAAVNWTPQAESRLKEVPFFVRPVVRKRIESLAAEAGQSEVTESFYDQARAQFGQS